MSAQYQQLNELMVELFQLILRAEENAMRNVCEDKLSITEVHTMEAVADSGGKTMSEVAGRLGITISTLTININRLVKKEYVQRVRQGPDKRVVQLQLLPKGRRIVKIHRLFHSHMIRDAVKDMDDGEVNTLCKSLSALKQFFEAEYVPDMEER